MLLRDSSLESRIAFECYLREIGVDETLFQPDEERERRGELKLRVLKRALYGFEDILEGDAIMVRSRLLHPGVEEGAGHAETEHGQAEPDADDHLGRAWRDRRQIERFVVEVHLLRTVFGTADVPYVAAHYAGRHRAR